VEAAVAAALAAHKSELQQWFDGESRALSLANRKLQDSMQLVESSRITDLETRLGEGMLRLETKVDATVAAVNKQGRKAKQKDKDEHHYTSSEDESEMVNLVTHVHRFCVVLLFRRNHNPNPTVNRRLSDPLFQPFLLQF